MEDPGEPHLSGDAWGYGEEVPDIVSFSVGSMVQEGLESLFLSLVIEADSRRVTHRMEGALLDPTN